MNIQISDAARDDLIKGYNYYEDKSEGIGRYFLEPVEALKRADR